MRTRLIVYELTVFVMLTIQSSYAGSVVITYNENEQLLGVIANQASLTEVLKEISAKTGIEIRIDPAIERRASFAIKPQPLEKVLGSVVKKLSYVMKYKTMSNVRYVTGLDILPKGKQDSGQLVRILPTVGQQTNTNN